MNMRKYIIWMICSILFIASLPAEEENAEKNYYAMVVTEQMIIHWNLWLHLYYLEFSEYPESLYENFIKSEDVWTRYYIGPGVPEKLFRRLKDAWENEFIYTRVSPEQYILRSMGASIESTEDDLTTLLPWGVWRIHYMSAITNAQFTSFGYALDQYANLQENNKMNMVTPLIHIAEKTPQETALYHLCEANAEFFSYQLKNGNYPIALTNLLNTTNWPSLDPWGNPYVYNQLNAGSDYIYYSYGPDGLADTDDDIRCDKKSFDRIYKPAGVGETGAETYE